MCYIYVIWIINRYTERIFTDGLFIHTTVNTPKVHSYMDQLKRVTSKKKSIIYIYLISATTSTVLFHSSASNLCGWIHMHMNKRYRFKKKKSYTLWRRKMQSWITTLKITWYTSKHSNYKKRSLFICNNKEKVFFQRRRKIKVDGSGS